MNWNINGHLRSAMQGCTSAPITTSLEGYMIWRKRTGIISKVHGWARYKHVYLNIQNKTTQYKSEAQKANNLVTEVWLQNWHHRFIHYTVLIRMGCRPTTSLQGDSGLVEDTVTCFTYGIGQWNELSPLCFFTKYLGTYYKSGEIVHHSSSWNSQFYCDCSSCMVMPL